jgi:hypothetical protein
MNWLSENYQWIFSGIGVLILGLLFQQNRKGKKTTQSISSSNNVTQIGGDATFGDSHDKTLT